jgi:hypothetical protein
MSAASSRFHRRVAVDEVRDVATRADFACSARYSPAPPCSCWSALVGAALSMAWGGRECLCQLRPGLPLQQQLGPGREQFGALVPIYGTVVTASIAMLIAVPVSFGIAVFLTEVSPAWLRAGGSAARSNCWPASRPSSTACGACSCWRR